MRAYLIKDDPILSLTDKWPFTVLSEIVGVGGYEAPRTVLNTSHASFVEEDMQITPAPSTAYAI